MLLKTLGRNLAIGFIGLGLSATPSAAKPTFPNRSSGGFRGTEFHTYQKVDRDDRGRFDFDRDRGFRGRSFYWGYDPWWDGWGWGFGWGYGWPYWGPYPNNYYYPSSQPTGKVKIETHTKDARVYVDGGYVGTVHERNNFSLKPGKHQLELRAPDGETFKEQVYVLEGQTVIVRPDFRAHQPAAG